MKTPLSMPGDRPPLILFFDAYSRVERLLDSGLDDLWFDYEIVPVTSFDAARFIIADHGKRPDLLLVAEDSWRRGGCKVVHLLRKQPQTRDVPVYGVQSQGMVPVTVPADCLDLRLAAQCTDLYFGKSEAYAHLLRASHPARLDGIVSAGCLRERLPEIVERMAEGCAPAAKT